MNLSDFAVHRERLLAHNPSLLDLSDTRFASLLATHRPQWPLDTLPGRAYRCHLVEDWLAGWGLPAAWKPRALASRGVRHNLATLFAGWAQDGRTVALPGDVYPVYHVLAKQAGLRTVSFATLPTMGPIPIIPSRTSPVPAPTPYPDADVLLLADPVKPRGTGLGPDELSALLAWLHASPHRRVVIDAVYALGPSLPFAVQRLLETDRAIVLHSLSKGWITAEVFGVALVPEQDVARWTPVFRALPTLFPDDQDDAQAHERRLKIAQLCLSPAHGAGFPQRLAQAMIEADQALDRALLARNVRPIGPIPGLPVPRYLRAVPYPVETLWRQHGILGLPLSTFGSTSDAWSVVTALPWLGKALATPSTND